MKKISELGISPWPWKNRRTFIEGKTVEATFSSLGEIVVDIKRVSVEDARLIAAAPELYDCLREAVVESCHECEDDTIEHCREKCFIAKWRDALAKAGGESEVEE